MKKAKVVTSTQRPEFDELMEYLARPVSERDGYDYDQEGDIYNIPSVFAKINGTYKDTKKYREKIVDKITKFPNTHIITNGIFSRSMTTLSRDNYNVSVYANKEKYLKQGKDLPWYEPDVNNFLYGKIYGYTFSISNNFGFRNLSNSKKNAMFSAMLIMASDPEINCISLQRLIEALINIPEYIVTLVNNWNFKSTAPRIVYTGKYKMTETEYWLLKLLHKIGFDIIILCPKGENIIEEYCDITTYSLGYYEKGFDFERYSYSTVDKLAKVGENIADSIAHIDMEDHLWFVVPLIVLWLNAATFIWSASGGLKTFAEIFGIIVLIVCWMYEIGFTAWSEDKGNVAHIIGIIILAVVALVRGVVALSSLESESNIKKGFLPIVEEAHLSTNDANEEEVFVTHVKSDMIGLFEDERIYCYIENNSENTGYCYVKIYIGNTEVYKSNYFNSLQYLNWFEVSYDLPKGDTEVTIKYYKYDPHRGTSYTSELLGEEKATIHIGDFEELASEYGYDYLFEEVEE